MLINEIYQFVEENQLLVKMRMKQLIVKQSKVEQTRERIVFMTFHQMIKAVPPCTDRIEVDAVNYLSTAKELDFLHRYPIIKPLFLKYNTILPLQCSCSLRNMMLTPKPNGLVDARFEKLLLICYKNTSYNCNCNFDFTVITSYDCNCI